MKNLKKLIGIIFVVAIIVCAMASCELFGGLGGGGTPTTPTTPGGDGNGGGSTPGSGTVTGVSLDKSSVNLLVGGTEVLTASITPSTATNQNVTWTSSNDSAATVSAGGLVTAVAAGTATITVKTQDGDKTASCEVTVNSIPVSSVSLKSSTSIIVGSTETLFAVIDPPNAANQNVTWDSNNTGVATVSANGAVTAVAAGTATITVKTADGNKTAACSVSVVTSAVAVTGVTLNKSSTSLNVGGYETLEPTITPSNATNQNLTWNSNNTGVATVSANGVVTAVAQGTATITVKTQDGDKTASCTVTVNPIAVSSVSLKTSTTIGIGVTELLSPIILPSNAANKSVTWTSSNDSVATVSAGGVVTAVAAGTATVTVTTVDGGKTASCTVTVTAPAPTIPTFTTVAAFETWLNAQPYNTANTAYNVALNLSSLNGLDTVLRNTNKYVSIDFSGSTFTSIGNSAFYYCTSLVNVTIGNSVTSIEWGVGAYFSVFYDCTSLTAINVASGNNMYTSEDGVLYNKNKTTLVLFPPAKIGSFTIPNSITSIGDYAFNESGLTSVTIPNSVTSIGRYPFYCTSLTAISVASGNNAFTAENDVLYNKNKTTLVRYPARKTGSTFTIPDSVTSIEEGAFGSCTSLTNVTFQGTIASNNLHNDAFGKSINTSYIGDLRAKYLAGGPGTYTRPNTGYGGRYMDETGGNDK